MKKLLFLPLLCALFAEEKHSESLRDYHPVHVGAQSIFISRANMCAPQGGDLFFDKVSSSLYMLLPVSRTSYFFPRVDWNYFTLDWDRNPRFREKEFNYLQFSLMFYSTGLEHWRWIVRFDYSIDVEHFDLPSRYSLYNGLVWGAYEFHPKWHYHVGALGYRGMRGEQVYPIIGLDFSPNKIWTFQAIFPIDYSIQYNFLKLWRLSLKVRPLKERFRVGKGEADPRAIFSYSSVGSELNLHFEIERRFELELYTGYNFGGHFYIKDRHGKNPLYTDFQGAPYAGASLDYAF